MEQNLKIPVTSGSTYGLLTPWTYAAPLASLLNVIKPENQIPPFCDQVARHYLFYQYSDSRPTDSQKNTTDEN